MSRRSRLGLAVCSALWSVGCTNVIVPPVAPVQPRPVYLLDHGRHASLVLPAPDSGLVRYAYGDWKYYAEMRTGVVEASSAILWNTRAGLGRRQLAEPATPSGVRRALRVGVEVLYEVIVGSDEIEALRTRLDSLFNSQVETRMYNASYDLEFVHHPRSYNAFHNSNRVAAQWLRELGCRVSGLLLFSSWKLRDPAER